MAHSTDATNLFVESFHSDRYKMLNLTSNVGSDTMNGVRRRIRADEVFGSFEKIENPLWPLFLRVNELQASTPDTLCFEDIFYLKNPFGKIPQEWSAKIKVIDYEKRGTESYLNPYLGLDFIPTDWTGIATYEVTLDAGEVYFQAYAEKSIYKAFSSYSHMSIMSILQLGDMYILEIHDANDNYDCNGSYLLYPKAYDTRQLALPTGNILALSVKSHRYLPIRVEEIVAVDAAGKSRAVFHPNHASSAHESKPDKDKTDFRKKIDYYWDDVGFDSQYIPFTPGKLQISWYSINEDKYYADEMQLEMLGIEPHKINDSVGFGYFKQLGISFFPEGKLAVSINRKYQTYLKCTEGMLSEDVREKYRKEAGSDIAKYNRPELIRMFDRQLRFYTWSVEYGYSPFYCSYTVHDGSVLSCDEGQRVRSPLPQTIDMILLNGEYELYFDVFELDTFLSQNLAAEEDHFKIRLNFGKQSELESVSIQAKGKDIPYTGVELIKKR